MNNAREQACMPICFFSVLSLFTGIIFINSTLKYVEIMNLVEKDCNITSITYPMNYPTENNTEGWESCDCGKNCESLTSCIQLYANINNTTNTTKKISPTNKYIYNDCTFYNPTCMDNENPISIQKEMVEARETYLQYINETVDCFYNTKKDTLYLEKDTNSRRVMIVSGTIMGMFILFLLLIYICIYVEERREKKERNRKQITV
jgi:hypothetical protein